ncbi:AraC family transcriptional regulator [Paenibacillus sp. IB182496]|uniref:AraC family transcriptional regulator n=2 Tax=Paenibacillus sabuli TaxID=2772509 RepID=A0A927BRV8_9BACL|nr:AraC family transcriptional regulator [Paenibacillus sabuli]
MPLALAYRDTKSSQCELPDHLHDWYELVYVYAGSGVFFIDRSLYEMKAGDLFLIPGNTIHRAFPEAANPVTSTALYFSPALVQQTVYDDFAYLDSFRYCAAHQAYKYTGDEAFGRQTRTLLDAVHAELGAFGHGARSAARLLLLQLLLLIGRRLQSGGTEGPQTAGPPWMRESMAFIDDRLTETLSLSLLARRAAVSPAHFSRVFRQLTGLNVTAYITTKRIVRAKELLARTDDGIGEIAARCGFESLPHFHRVFKRIVGRTPGSYRSEGRF